MCFELPVDGRMGNLLTDMDDIPKSKVRAIMFVFDLLIISHAMLWCMQMVKSDR